MFKEKLRNRPWYPTAVAICIGVAVYVALSRFPEIWDGVRTFLGYFKPLFMGCALAYIINPLTVLLYDLLGGIKKEGARRGLANALAFVAVILFIAFAFMILIPQLIESIQTFSNNFEGYVASIEALMRRWGISLSEVGASTNVDVEGLISSSEDLLGTISRFVGDNLDQILATSVNTGKGLFSWVIAFILSIYMINEKESLLKGMRRLLKALFGSKRYERVSAFLGDCNQIFSRYIVFNLIDSLIIGAANAVFMTICGMQYVGLTSLVVAVTNLVPTFGPVAGAIIGAFVLLMVKPIHALVFVIFTLVLQTLDGYVIKPRLFGSSLGVSGLWILVGVIVGGNMFGMVGILLAIPSVAVLDLIYTDYLLPALDRRAAAQADEPSAQE